MEKQVVLIVDDELDMRIFLSTLFETSGYKTLVAKNGTEGIKTASEFFPDLIILDIMMPGEGGVFMYQQLRISEELKKIPVIMLSAIANKTFSHYLKMLNARLGGVIPQPDAYMEKPPEAEELLSIGKKLMAASKEKTKCTNQETGRSNLLPDKEKTKCTSQENGTGISGKRSSQT